MKTIKSCILFCLVMFPLFITACGGGGNGSGTGTLSMSVTDAKPLLPGNVTNLFVEFSEIWVHKSGGGWQQLPLTETPYTIDLLQFQDGDKTELVPPAILDAGKYTQVRFFVTNAIMRMSNDETTDQIIEIPSENLKTDKNFTIDLTDGSAIDLIIHFDLSMSVVATGTGTYQMKPVLHLFEDPLQAAIISGSIDNASFGLSEKATVMVLDSNDIIYTKAEIEKSTTDDPTDFSIFWLVPNQIYTVQIDLNQDGTIDCNEYEELIPMLGEGDQYPLNSGVAVILGTDDCAP
ncbi:MAG: hypothetical protein VR64_15190 [Desulfatitalea sp. BRH_c12]|nr:MAG: hypothetical protein VR64_15190 [Desulfatitalea sp. BRH_c12]